MNDLPLTKRLVKLFLYLTCLFIGVGIFAVIIGVASGGYNILLFSFVLLIIGFLFLIVELLAILANKNAKEPINKPITKKNDYINDEPKYEAPVINKNLSNDKYTFNDDTEILSIKGYFGTKDIPYNQIKDVDVLLNGYTLVDSGVIESKFTGSIHDIEVSDSLCSNFRVIIKLTDEFYSYESIELSDTLFKVSSNEYKSFCDTADSIIEKIRSIINKR